jgi:hypothetical protein
VGREFRTGVQFSRGQPLPSPHRPLLQRHDAALQRRKARVRLGFRAQRLLDPARPVPHLGLTPAQHGRDLLSILAGREAAQGSQFIIAQTRAGPVRPTSLR